MRRTDLYKQWSVIIKDTNDLTEKTMHCILPSDALMLLNARPSPSPPPERTRSAEPLPRSTGLASCRRCRCSPIKIEVRTMMKLRGKVSVVRRPRRHGRFARRKDLAFIYEVDDAPHLFLPKQPPGTTGLARRLNPDKRYIACRWDYDEHPKPSLLEHTALVRNVLTDEASKPTPPIGDRMSTPTASPTSVPA